MSGASSGMWFAHRLNDWSKLAKERVRRATDGSQDSTTNLSEKNSTSSDDGMQPKDSQKSANSSFEVRETFTYFLRRSLSQSSMFAFRTVTLRLFHRNHLNHHHLCCNTRANHFHRDTFNERRAYRAKAV